MIKYSKAKHIKGLIKKGEIRIGTMHDYRNSEYKEGIQDNLEGRKNVKLSIKTLDLSARDNQTSSIVNGFLGGQITGQGAIQMVGDGPMFINKIDTPNHFVFCASHCRTDLVPKKFAYDAGVKIINTDKFIEIISNELKRKFNAELIYFDKIKYQPKDEEWNYQDWGDNPMFFKDESFSYQNEIRAIWSTPIEEIKPVVLILPELKKYCHQIKLT